MPRVFPLRTLALALVLLLPAAPFALLCRGRTPTRFDAQNLPAWERHAHALHPISRNQRRIGGLRAAGKRRLRSVS